MSVRGKAIETKAIRVDKKVIDVRNWFCIPLLGKMARNDEDMSLLWIGRKSGRAKENGLFYFSVKSCLPFCLEGQDAGLSHLVVLSLMKPF
jgi:hypothetical protein